MTETNVNTYLPARFVTGAPVDMPTTERVGSTGHPHFSRIRRENLRALRAAATDGQWVRTDSIHAESAIAVAGFEYTRRVATLSTAPPDYGRSNADCIVESVNALPEVLDALDALEADRDDWRRRALAAEDALLGAERSR